MLTEKDVLKTFQDSEALLSGHFILSSGLHSDRYLQCALVLQHAELSYRLCAELAERFRNDAIEVVISPAIGGIIVGQEVARALDCMAIFCEKENGKLILRRGFSIKKGSRALVVEDVITTGGSIKRVADIVRENGGIVAGYGCIVDRSGEKLDFKLEKLLSVQAKTYKPEECPMCSQGISFKRPGSR
jgi:orotate phosphoribosyltransferase